MKTIRFIVALAFILFLVPVASYAKMPLIGFASSSVTRASHPFLRGFKKGLRDLGYVEGKNIKIEYRFAKTSKELPELVADLLRLRVDLILAGGSRAIKAAKKATRTIPIVMTNSGDPVRSGFIASIARPGGMITGLTQSSPELAGKRLEILKETVPRISRVAVLWYPLHPNTPNTFKETQIAAQKLKLRLLSLKVKNPEDFKGSFAVATSERVEGLIVLRDPFTIRHRRLITESAMNNGLPAIYETSDFVEAGGLMYYGPNFSDLYRRSVGYIDKILKGAKPADLPVERPIKFDLVINMKIAKKIGLTIPPIILMRADKVIK